MILAFNDHATRMMLDIVPTFAIGCADRFQPADEGWGARPLSVIEGHPEFAAHLAQSLVRDEFDNAFLADMTADPGHLRRLGHIDYLREAGSEGVELIMWLIMLAAIGEADDLYRFYHVPASNAAVGHVVLRPRAAAAGAAVTSRAEPA